jgi:hypothetical protein
MKPGHGGHIILPQDVITWAAALAARDFAEATGSEYSDESVRDILIPYWMDAAGLLAKTGAPLRAGGRSCIYATCGVEKHVDNMDGLSVCLVLHANGFTFVQGRNRLRLQTGDWFVFDDRLLHEVKETEQSTTLLVLTHPIEDKQ